MNRTPISLPLSCIPEEFHSLLHDAKVFDSSCSRQAKVYFVDRDDGYYLKSSPAGTLKTEAEMTRFFHKKSLGAQVLSYINALDRDWLLTRRVPGEDCTLHKYLDDPQRLSVTLAVHLRKLHEISFSGCPVADRMVSYRETVERNYRHGMYDHSLFPDNWGFTSAEEAIAQARICMPDFQSSVLIHGDYCLPNIMLNDWQFSGFIDVGNGGVGDRHIDLFWGIWSLAFNLKTTAYTERFLSAYGSDLIEREMLRGVAACEVFG
ncbi:MAG: aminoglycoside 3'-phosphotransferase [Clostridia bacterium]|nr:aminoglycoside 3'-phosphotransferase [Clostridia bacterium]